MLYLYRRIAFGEQKNADAAAMEDLDGREIWLLAPIAATVMWMGVYPESFIAPIRDDVSKIVARVAPATPVIDGKFIADDPSTEKYRVGANIDETASEDSGSKH